YGSRHVNSRDSALLSPPDQLAVVPRAAERSPRPEVLAVSTNLTKGRTADRHVIAGRRYGFRNKRPLFGSEFIETKIPGQRRQPFSLQPAGPPGLPIQARASPEPSRQRMTQRRVGITHQPFGIELDVVVGEQQQVSARLVHAAVKCVCLALLRLMQVP